MAIARNNMRQEAAKPDCEQPYIDQSALDDELEDTNASVVGSFFSRFKGK